MPGHGMTDIRAAALAAEYVKAGGVQTVAVRNACPGLSEKTVLGHAHKLINAVEVKQKIAEILQKNAESSLTSVTSFAQILNDIQRMYNACATDQDKLELLERKGFKTLLRTAAPLLKANVDLLEMAGVSKISKSFRIEKKITEYNNVDDLQKEIDQLKQQLADKAT
jgi:hypothetical protein